MAAKTDFPVGFVYDFFHLLNEDKKLDSVKQREIPALLEKGYGAKGQAAFLVIEPVDLDVLSEPYPHPIKMSNIPIGNDFQKTIARAFEYIQHELLISGNYTEYKLPVFRWWVA